MNLVSSQDRGGGGGGNMCESTCSSEQHSFFFCSHREFNSNTGCCRDEITNVIGVSCFKC